MLLIALALGFIALFLVLPLVTVFVEALRKGWDAYLAALVEPDALAAIRLTLLAAAHRGAGEPGVRRRRRLGDRQVRVPRQAIADRR